MSLLATLGPNAPVAQAYGRVGDPRALSALVGGTECVKALESLRLEQPNQAIRVIAGWLSTREAIWWAALCQSQLLDLAGHDQAGETLKLVVLWVRDPGEPTRLAVANRARVTESPSLAQLATAVTLTADSLSPFGASPVPAPAGLAHRMAALSILAAANEWPNAGQKGCLAHFLEMGLDVSECQYPWSESAMAKHPGLRPRIGNTTGKRKLGNIWEDW
jgi:hypothetical protein